MIKSSDRKQNIAVLDGVRAIACFLVIGYHLNFITAVMHAWNYRRDPLTSSVAMMGGTGVLLFFVLSGFLLFMPYAKAILFEKQWPLARWFYLRRILRIWPGYFVALFALILWSHQEYLQPSFRKNLVLFLTFFMDSSSQTYMKINGPFWTLAVEWQFYLFLPVIALGFGLVVKWIVGTEQNSLWKRWWVLVGCLAVLFAWGVFSRFVGPYLVSHPDKTVLIPRSVFDEIWFFLYGMNGKFMEDFAIGMLISSAFILLQKTDSEEWIGKLHGWLENRSMWFWGVGIIWLTFMAIWDLYHSDFRFSFQLLNTINQGYYGIREASFGIGYGLCMLAILFGPPGLKMVFEWMPLRWLGFISYGLYIWHLPILTALESLLTTRAQSWNHLLLYSFFWLCILLIAVPFSYLFYQFIEKPWMWIGDQLRKKSERKKIEALSGERVTLSK